jgi:hypothetical protein
MVRPGLPANTDSFPACNPCTAAHEESPRPQTSLDGPLDSQTLMTSLMPTVREARMNKRCGEVVEESADSERHRSAQQPPSYDIFVSVHHRTNKIVAGIS